MKLSGLLFLFLSFTIHVNAQMLDGIAAIVGEDIILYSDLEYQHQYMLSNGQTDDGTLRCEILENLLISKLLLNKARQDSIEVSDDQVDSELNRRLGQMEAQMGKGELEKIYGKSMLEIRQELRIEVKDQLLIEQQRQKIMNGIKVTPKEVKDFFKEIPSDSLPFLPAEVELFQIVIKSPFSASSIEKTKSQLETIREEILSGKDFTTFAAMFSMDPGSAKSGGSLGEFSRGVMVPEFEAKVFTMKEGDISEPFMSPFGMHIIKLHRRIGDKVTASHILIVPEKTKDDEALALRKLETIRNAILKDSITFQAAAVLYTMDASAKSCGGCVQNPQTGETRIPLDYLDPELYLTVDALKVNEISKPTKYLDPEAMDEYFRIVMLKTKIPPHVANLSQDYAKLLTATTQTKQASELEKWFLQARKNIHVEVRDKNCQSALKHWNDEVR